MSNTLHGGRGVAMPVLGRPALPKRVTTHVSGGRDQWSAPLVVAPADPRGAVRDALREVLDPEIPISVVDLGLIYGAEYEDGVVRIDLTFTATACPCMAFINEDITDRLEQEPWIDRVELNEVWDPPWTRERITEQGKAQLKTMGVGV